MWNNPGAKDKLCRIPCVWDTKSSQIHRDRGRMVIAKDGEGGNGKLLSNGLQVSVWEGEILDMNGGDGTTTWMSVMILNCIF